MKKHRLVFLFVLAALAGHAAHLIGVAEAATPYSKPNLWPGISGKYPVNVCFQGTGTAAHRALVEIALTNTWEAFSGIDFIFKGTCPSPAITNWLPIELKFSPTPIGTSGVCGVGVGATCEVTYGSSLKDFESVVVHEVGHGLTLRHEHGRSDWPGRAEGVWSNPPPAPQTTRDTWKCDRHTSGAANDPDGAGSGKGYHSEEPGLLLVRVDPASIMAPWLCDPNRRGFTNFWDISYLDKLGVEMLYPLSFTRSARGRYGFVAQNGIVVRSDDTLETDWHFRGALTTAYFQPPTWKYGHTTISSPWFPKEEVRKTYGLSVSSLGSSGTQKVSVAFKDVFLRDHSGTTSVLIDNAMHTALVLSSLGI